MLYVAGDGFATSLIESIKEYLKLCEIEFLDISPTSAEPTLQEVIPSLVERVRSDPDGTGILACGTGVGVAIGANRFQGARAVLCMHPQQAEFARVYDDANILCMGSWTTTDPGPILDSWFGHEFDGSDDQRSMLAAFDTWR